MVNFRTAGPGVTAHVRNATWSGFSAAVRAATGLLMAMLAVRLLGGVRYGQLATLLSLFVLYLSLNSSIFTVLVTKLVGAPETGHDHKKADVLSAATIFAIASIAVLVLLTVLIGEIAPLVFSPGEEGSGIGIEIRWAAMAMSVLTAIQILVALHSAIIEGAGRLDLATKWQLAGPLAITFTLFLLFILHRPLSALGYVMVLCCGALIDLSLLMLLRYRLSLSPPSLRLSHGSIAQIWGLLRSGTTLQAASLMNLFLEPLNKFLLNHFAGALAVTGYDLAMKLIWGIQSLFAAAMRVFLHLSGEQGQVVGQAFSRVLTLVLVPVLAVHTVAAIFLAWVTHHWVAIGDPRQFMVFFGIATVSNLGMIYITPLYISLIGRGDMRSILRSQTIVAITNLLVSVALVPQFGLLGAAIGLLCATLFNVIAIYLRHERTVGESGGLKPVLKGRSGRYAMSTLLFAAAILTGAAQTVNIFAAASILLVVGIILIREPLVGTLAARLRPGK